MLLLNLVASTVLWWGLCVRAIEMSYEGSQLWRVSPGSKKEVDVLETLRDQFDFWAHPAIGRPTDVLVDKGNNATFFKVLEELEMKPELLIENVQPLIEEDLMSTRRRNSAMNWANYQSTGTIHNWLDNIAQQHPVFTKLYTIGRSTEGRPLKLIKIGIPQSGRRKKAYFIDGGFHAREWISPAVVTWYINQLVENAHQYREVLRDLDFYILPIANPDGYEYSRTRDRLWRKTRSRTSNQRCYGVDLNRNFNFHWNGPGNSNNPCTETYKGPRAFSEPESDAMRRFIAAKNATEADWRIYTSVHSYGQVILSSWGYTYHLPSDHQELKRLGERASEAVAVPFRSKYRAGAISELLPLGSGASDDWAKGSGFFKYSYTYEVRDSGRYGFILPSSQIQPTAQETWQGIQVMANYIRELP